MLSFPSFLCIIKLSVAGRLMLLMMLKTVVLKVYYTDFTKQGANLFTLMVKNNYYLHGYFRKKQ